MRKRLRFFIFDYSIRLDMNMKKYKVLLWDIDGTILNFEEAEKVAIRKCFEIHNLGVCTDEMLARYIVINRKYWEALEKGQMTKPEILVGRFKEFFEAEGLDVSKAAPFNDDYQVRLGDTVCFCDNAYELVQDFQKDFLQYAVTNGTKIAQERKLKNSKLNQEFKDIFISDVIGYEKPSIEFFDAVLSAISDIDKKEMLIIGDSLTSDMRGGNNAGIATCWYNPKGLVNDKGVHIDYEIKNLNELRDLLYENVF